MNFWCTVESELCLFVDWRAHEVPGKICMQDKVKTEAVYFLCLSIRFDTIFLSAVLRSLSFITIFSRTTTWNDQLIRIITVKTDWIFDVSSMFLSKTCLLLQNESTGLLISQSISDQICLFSFIFIFLADILYITPLSICENNDEKFGLYWGVCIVCFLCLAWEKPA